MAAIHRPFAALVRKPWYEKLLIWFFYIYSGGLIATMLFLLFTGDAQPLSHLTLNPSTSANGIAALSSGVASILVLWGVWQLRRGFVKAALQKFENALLVTIFVTQTFLFFRYQLTAGVVLVISLILLFSVRMLLADRVNQSVA